MTILRRTSDCDHVLPKLGPKEIICVGRASRLQPASGEPNLDEGMVPIGDVRVGVVVHRRVRAYGA